MIETTFGELDIGDEYYAFDYEPIRPSQERYKRTKCDHGCMRFSDTKGGEILEFGNTVYIKEKKMTDSRMTDKEQAQERIDAMKVELKKLEKIISKPERIKVPDCIDIGPRDGALAVLFNGQQQRLYQGVGKYGVDISSHKFTVIHDLYLEPCKREDLKPGDVAYMRQEENDFTSSHHYHCILDDKNYAWVTSDGIAISAIIYNHCWKVVK